MTISLECPHCGHTFAAWDDLVGQTIACPTCQGGIVVGASDDDELEDDDEFEDDDDEFRLAPAEESILDKSPAMNQPLLDDEYAEEEEYEDDDTELDVESVQANECPECGARIDDGMLCGECGYHLQLRRKINSEVETFGDNKETGFKRWVGDQLAEGESVESAGMWMMIGGGALLLVFTFCLFPYSLIITIPAIIGVIAVFVIGKRTGKGGFDGVLAVGGRATLSLVRSTGWRDTNYPFAKLSYYSGRGSDFGDADLASMPNPGDIKALDLEGCPVTDEGIGYLLDWPHLRYLVLFDTQVTREGVVDFQTRMPRTIVWYE